MKEIIIAGGCGILFFGIIYLLFIQKTSKTKASQRLQSFNKVVETDGTDKRNNQMAYNWQEQSLYQRVVSPILKKIQNFALQFTPQSVHDMLAKKILLSGRQYKWRLSNVAVIWLLSIVLFMVIAYFYIMRQREFILLQKIVIFLVGAGIGAYLPVMIFNILIERRQSALLRQVPEVLDLLCVSVQAGLSFDGSLLRITEKMQGAFIEECREVINDINMGTARKMALQKMAKRCQLQEIQLFTTAIIQSERLGTSMAKTLTIQADNMRERRMQKAKAKALQAPVKIIFPLVLFIFPALFVVVLLPSLLQLMKGMGH